MSKEDIKKAKAENAERIANIAYSGGGHIGQDDLETAFENGAEWRINSVWRDVIEKPNFSNIPILIQHKNGRIHFIDAVPSSWIYIQKYYIRWAYIEDLIPNMEE